MCGTSLSGLISRHPSQVQKRERAVYSSQNGEKGLLLTRGTSHYLEVLTTEEIQRQLFGKHSPQNFLTRPPQEIVSELLYHLDFIFQMVRGSLMRTIPSQNTYTCMITLNRYKYEVKGVGSPTAQVGLELTIPISGVLQALKLLEHNHHVWCMVLGSNVLVTDLHLSPDLKKHFRLSLCSFDSLKLTCSQAGVA